MLITVNVCLYRLLVRLPIGYVCQQTMLITSLALHHRSKLPQTKAHDRVPSVFIIIISFDTRQCHDNVIDRTRVLLDRYSSTTSQATVRRRSMHGFMHRCAGVHNAIGCHTPRNSAARRCAVVQLRSRASSSRPVAMYNGH